MLTDSVICACYAVFTLTPLHQLWQLSSANPTPVLLHTFNCATGGAVLALAARGETVFAGCQDGHVKVWDLETRTLVRTLIVVEVSAYSVPHSIDPVGKGGC